MTLLRFIFDAAHHDCFDSAGGVGAEFGGDVDGVAAKGFLPKRQKLSFYAYDNSDLLRKIIACFAATRSGFDDVHYCIMDESEFSDLELHQSPGNLNCAEVDGAHYDLCAVSMPVLNRVVCRAVKNGRVDTIRPEDVERVVRAAYQEGIVQLKHVNRKMAALLQAGQ